MRVKYTTILDDIVDACTTADIVGRKIKEIIYEHDNTV